MHQPSATVLKHCSAKDLEHHLDDFGGLLHACVHDGANVGFVLPFDVSDSLEFWRRAVLLGLWQGTPSLVLI